MKHPLMIVPGAMQAALALGDVLKASALPPVTRSLIHLRVSQLNGCSYCVDMAAGELRTAGDTERRIATVAAWRDAPWFTAQERAALALAEAAARIGDRADAVPDALWAEVSAHLDEAMLAATLVQVAVTSLWNHVNVPIRKAPAADPH